MSGSVVIGSWRLCNLNSTSVQLWPSFQSIDLQQLQRERELMLELHINCHISGFVRCSSMNTVRTLDHVTIGRCTTADDGLYHTRSTATMLTLFDAMQDEFVDQKLRNCTSSQCFCHDNDR
ncbi:hypothetical protein T4D_12438 [Trichinella pseudospiralis]|uniref:Uncharacterized protein n=1 Tax=Trichinella pseudospiralis TaxID=6337 RepID=A0A0V1F8C4_TRIPS|nr:hypothetical protein T4D_12438 [Trichinella pseudospiralis]